MKQYHHTKFNGIQQGIFFRSPFQQFDIDLYDGHISWLWKPWQNPLLFICNLGKNKQYRNIINNGYNAAGIRVRTITSPIYFKRKIRTAIVEFIDHPIYQSISVFGEEPYKNRCSGACIVEKTIFTLRSGKKVKYKRYGNFHYWYEHILKEENIL